MTIDQSTLLDDRYRLDEQIGTGGMADVFRATDEVLNRTVAVKVLREVSDEGQRNRFIEEAKTLAILDHPGLITLLDAGIRGERPYLVMTLVDDATLSARIAEGPLAPEDVQAIGIQLARALAYAHGQGIVHRDVKPSNVLLCGDGRVLLADFGIARLVGSADHHTRTGDTVGSPAYLAPEQVAAEDLTPALDIYSLGLVLLEALTGVRAFPGTPIEAAIARLNAAPPMPTSLDPEWRQLLARMTHRIPENRPSAAEVAEELVALGGTATGSGSSSFGSLTGSATGLRPIPAAVPADDAEATGDMAVVTMESPFHSAGPVGLESTYNVEPRRRHRVLLIGLGLMALVLVAAFFLWLRPGQSSHPSDAPGAPTNVPSRFQQPLSDLHDAVNGGAR